MFEADATHQLFQVDTLEDWLLLDLVEEETDARARSDRKRLRLAVRFIANNRIEPESGEGHAGWDEEGIIEIPGFVDTLGGEGTPLVAIGAPVHWATATKRSLGSGKHFLANTMDLQYRFPRLHAKVEALEVTTWTAFGVCEDTRTLSWECARWIDEALAERGLYGQRSLDMVIKTGVAKFHPDLIKRSGVVDKDDWDVTLDHNPNGTPGGGNGTSRMEATADSVDLKKFLDAVCDEAATAGRLGDTDTFAQRKAKALGTIADRQATLDMGGLLDSPHNTDSCCAGSDCHSGAGAAGAEAGDCDCGSGTAGSGTGPRATVNSDGDLVHPETGKVIHRRTSYGKARFFVHFTAEDLAAFTDGDLTGFGDAGAELGPQSVERLIEWLKAFGPDAKITPVIDLGHEWSVDRHDPPEEMREQVILRDQHCVFPNCVIDARRCDLDHIEAYDEHGPPGQTDPENLAPLCRRHHLVKTHGAWVYVRNKDGTYRWTSPLSRIWLVTPFGTTDIS